MPIVLVHAKMFFFSECSMFDQKIKYSPHQCDEAEKEETKKKSMTERAFRSSVQFSTFDKTLTSSKAFQ